MIYGRRCPDNNGIFTLSIRMPKKDFKIMGRKLIPPKIPIKIVLNDNTLFK